MSNENNQLDTNNEDDAFEKAFKAYKVESSNLPSAVTKKENHYNQNGERPDSDNNNDDNIINNDDDIDNYQEPIKEEKSNPKKEENTEEKSEEKAMTKKELAEFFKQQREEEALLKKAEEDRLNKELESKKLQEEKEALLKESALNKFEKDKVYSEEEKENIKRLSNTYGPEMETLIDLKLKAVFEALKHIEASVKQFSNQGLTNVEKAVYDKINTENDFKSQKEFLAHLEQQENQKHYQSAVEKIKTTHSDYEPNGKLENEMIAWVDKLKSEKYQGYLISLYQSGNPDDHISLYDEYKEANGIKKTQVKSNTPSKTSKQEDLERRRSALGAQSNGRSSAEISDKDASFEERFKAYKVKI